MHYRFLGALGATLSISSLLLTGCTDNDQASTTAPSTTSSTATATSPMAELSEVASISPRVVIAHDGGLSVIDSDSGEVISTTQRDGFLRLNNAGDGRHVLVTDSDAFVAFDAAVESRAHGDHRHNYAGTPELRDLSYNSEHAGHVVVHDGLTALFSDGEGTVRIVPSDDLATGTQPAEGVMFDSGSAHHGVAVPFADGSVLLTVGTEDERHTIQHRSPDNAVLAETEDCPGVHGEATAADGAAVFGCTNGPVVFDGSTFHKIEPAEGVEYQRSGNLAGHPDSPVVLGDYKVNEDAELERPTQINLIDTQSKTMKQVDLGSSYWFRSLGRGPAGEALVLTYDGHLKVIDPISGAVTDDIAAIAPWEEKDEWQEPGPILKVADDIAYITDAENKELVLVDLTSGEVTQRFSLDVAPVEIAVVDGTAH